MKFQNLPGCILFADLSFLFFDFSERRSFVYFLMDGEECVYIGQSTGMQIFSRIANHVGDRKNGKKDFDGVQVMQLETAYNNLDIEYILIRQFAPKYNKKGKHLPPMLEEDFVTNFQHLIAGNIEEKIVRLPIH